MISKEEARQLIRDAVREALSLRPQPSVVTITEAAAMLEVSPRTIVRMKPPRNRVGKIPYSWVLDMQAAR